MSMVLWIHGCKPCVSKVNSAHSCLSICVWPFHLPANGHSFVPEKQQLGLKHAALLSGLCFYLINSDRGLLSTKASYGDHNHLGSRRTALSLSHSFREKYWGGQLITDKIPPVGFLLQSIRVVKVCRHPASRSELYISASESSKSQEIFVSQWCEEWNTSTESALKLSSQNGGTFINHSH